MSEHFAEATVQITPSLRGFITKLNDDLTEIMAKVNKKPPVIRVAPGLQKGFIGNLTTQVNTAIASVQKQVKPIRVRVLIDQPSRRGLQEIISGAPISVPGAVTSAGGGALSVGAQQQADLEQRLSALRAQGARDLGLVAVAEDKVTKAREKGAAASKKSQVQETATARSKRLVGEVQKGLTRIDVNAATKTGELAQAKNALAQANKLVEKADEARAANVNRTTVDLQKQARAEQELRAQRVRDLEAAGVGTGPTATERAAEKARQRAIDAHVAAGRQQREANAADKVAGKTTKDLAAQRDILTTRTNALKDAERAYKTASTSSNAAVRATIPTITARRNALQAQVDESKALVKTLDDQTKAEKREASAGRRRSEQLSRGSQASLLSLAGIRGATLAASRSFLVGAATITVFARAVKQFADLERNLEVFRATTSATADQMEAVRKEATELGADLTLPAVAAGDAAGAMVELAKAGLTVQDSIDGARAVLELSTAAAIDNADAVRLVANVLNAFSLTGRDAAAVADTLANAANAAQGSIADIGTAFQQAASAGHQVGLSFQDTATFLTILAKNGIRGSDAGTSLRTALIRLVNPSKKAQEAFDKLGITLRDAAGNLRPDVFLQIAAATEKLGPAQRDATIALIGGQDAFRAVTILGRQSVGSFLAMRAALRQTGTAAELAKARTDGLHGAMDGLQSVLETVGTEAAGHVGPALASFVRSVAAGITALSESEQVARTLSQSLTAAGTAFNILGSAIKGVGAVAIPVADALSQLVTAVGVSQILAGVVAYKALGKALTVLGLSLNNPLAQFAKGEQQLALFTASTRASILTTEGFKRAIVGVASSFNIYLIAAAAATAAIAFIITRQSESEKVFNKAKDAVEGLAQALGDLKIANQEVASTQRSVTQFQDQFTQAVLDRIRAQQALRESDAPRGSLERRQLLLDLKIATQDVTFATQDYNKALKDLNETEEKQAAAQDLVAERRRDQIRTTRDLINNAIKEGEVASRRSKLPSAGPLVPELDAQAEGLDRIIERLGKLSKENRESSNEEQQVFGRRQAALVGFFRAADRIGRRVKPIVISAIFKAPDLAAAIKETVATMKFASKAGRDEFIRNIINFSGLGARAKAALLAELLPATENAVHSAAEIAKHRGGIEFEEAGKTLAEKMASGFQLNSRLLEAEALGATKQALLAIAQEELAGAQRRLTRAEKRLPPRGERTQKQQDLIDDLAQDVVDAQDEVDSLQGDITSAQKEAAQKLVDAQKDRDENAQKITDAITQGRKATLLQRKIQTAGLTEWLGDDLKTTQAWLDFLKGQRDTLVKRLKAAGASKAFITAAMKAISDLIFDVKNSLASIGKEIEDNTKKANDVLNSVVFQKIDIRIQIAQTQENVALELALRRKRLELITKELVKLKRAHKKNTLEWLELKLAQVEEIAAINDLTKTQKDRHNAFGELAFQFLQLQSGFAANLLGNLIPGGATGGLVGGSGFGGNVGSFAPTTVGPLGADGLTAGPSGLPGIDPLTGRPVRESGGTTVSGRVARDTGSAGVQGPTKSQAARTNFLLQQMLVLLRDIKRGQGHPEAKTRRTQTQNEFAQTGNV